MRSGYNDLWTEHALSELENTTEYLEKMGKEGIKYFFQKLDHIVELISKIRNFFNLQKKIILEELYWPVITTCIIALKKILLLFFLCFQTDRLLIKSKFKSAAFLRDEANQD